jgi:hypothetical protein
MRRLVPEDGAVDAGLPLTSSLVDAVVNEKAPDEHGVAKLGSEHEFLARPDEALVTLSPPVKVAVARVVPLIHLLAVKVAIFGDPPHGFHTNFRSLIMLEHHAFHTSIRRAK